MSDLISTVPFLPPQLLSSYILTFTILFFFSLYLFCLSLCLAFTLSQATVPTAGEEISIQKLGGPTQGVYKISALVRRKIFGKTRPFPVKIVTYFASNKVTTAAMILHCNN